MRPMIPVTLTAAAAFVALSLACVGGEASAPEVADDGTVDVPMEETGLRAKVPDNAKPNRGMAGFHSDDDSISVMIKEAPADADLASGKADAEAMLFKDWISAEETGDGYALQYESVGMDMEGNEYTQYTFRVVRDIDGTKYQCSGSVKDQAHLEANLAICNSLTKG